jgi:poly(3-hydroxyoctanoate) depolymerase
MRVTLLLLGAIVANCGSELPSTPSAGVDAGADVGLSNGSNAESDASQVTTDARATDANAADASFGSRCTVTPDSIECQKQQTAFTVQLVSRQVQWQVPTVPAPPAGYPVVIVFQGSLFGTEAMWSAKRADPYSAYFQAQVVQTLLDAGYAVLTPEARLGGSTYWDTNVPPYATFWTTSPDHALMLRLFQAIDEGAFGSLDRSRLYATGISSGGYMSSRMAEAYPGKFRAIAIHSGSWATCSGALCLVPDPLPTGHPPTLFLHGAQDAVVPISTAKRYFDRLQASGFTSRWVEDPNAGHEWVARAPAEIEGFFRQY